MDWSAGTHPKSRPSPRRCGIAWCWTCRQKPKPCWTRRGVRLTRQAEGHVDDDALVMAAIGALLDPASPEASGTATHLVQMTVCEECGHGEYAGGVVATRDEVSAAMCDARVVPADGGRANQTVTPKTKQRVLSKQSCECAAPGCRHRAFVDTHHLEPQQEGGGHHEENLVGLCSAHHQSAHRGALLVRKRGDELVFEHADGYELGDPRSSLERCQVLVAAFEVLVSRGFYETEAQLHLDRVRTAVRTSDSVARVLALADQARRRAALPDRDGASLASRHPRPASADRGGLGATPPESRAQRGAANDRRARRHARGRRGSWSLRLGPLAPSLLTPSRRAHPPRVTSGRTRTKLRVPLVRF